MRKLITTVLVSGFVVSIYLFNAGDSTAPNRDATCPVRLDPDFAADAGLRSVYQRALFPVNLTILPDAGREVVLPPMPVTRVRDAIEVLNWEDCTLAASTAPVAALWGTDIPFTRAGVAKPWCRGKFDAGLPCLLTDGGTFGDRNVSRCSERAQPSTCERVSGGSIYLGDDPEDL